ncbi:T7SS effector LXG polymorphic toxin [Bacillus velezensis]|nr:T7SS effector LXG polymorphic toxin [Bacillus velezensis]
MKSHFTSLPGKVEDAGLSNSHVEESFLEHELTHALSKSKAIMEGQKRTWGPSSERSKTSSRLICFQPKAQIRSFLQLTKRSETIHKLDKLDHDLTKEYTETEANEQFIQADFERSKTPQAKEKAPRRFTTTPKRTEKATSIRKRRDCKTFGCLFDD